MFKIDADKTINVSRGDSFSLDVRANNGEYTFQVGDLIKLRVYNKKGYTEEPLLEVSYTVTTAGTTQTIAVPQILFSGDINKPTTYWYEISVNEDSTIVAYDEDGAKLFIVYPADETSAHNNHYRGEITGTIYPRGAQGIGIASVVQTTTSEEDQGENVVTVTLTNGETSTFNVKNGSRGSQGEQGIQGVQGIQGEKGDTGDKGDTGEKGDTGDAGYSPTVSTSKVGKVTTITITDTNGEHTATINDGADGEGAGDMLTSVYDVNQNGIVDNAERVNNHTVNSDVPANAVFTDHTYTNVSEFINDADYISSTDASNRYALKSKYDTSISVGRKIRTTTGDNSIAFGTQNEASGTRSVALGSSNLSLGTDSVALGFRTVSGGFNSTSLGKNTTAIGDNSVSTGYGSQSIGENSHSEGQDTYARGKNSHSEGSNTNAEYQNEHVFGKFNDDDSTNVSIQTKTITANGDTYYELSSYLIESINSVTIDGITTTEYIEDGYGIEFNTAPSEGSTIVASFNVKGIVEGNYVEIVGNGTSNSARSNARTLDWQGNEKLAGKLTVGANPTNAMDVTTKQYVDANISKPKYKSIIIATTDWVATNDTYVATIVDNRVTANTFVDLVVNKANSEILGQVDIQSYAGYFTITAYELPSASVTGQVSYTNMEVIV